jgi:hypothetical protein
MIAYALATILRSATGLDAFHVHPVLAHWLTKSFFSAFVFNEANVACASGDVRIAALNRAMVAELQSAAALPPGRKSRSSAAGRESTLPSAILVA